MNKEIINQSIRDSINIKSDGVLISCSDITSERCDVEGETFHVEESDIQISNGYVKCQRAEIGRSELSLGGGRSIFEKDGEHTTVDVLFSLDIAENEWRGGHLRLAPVTKISESRFSFVEITQNVGSRWLMVNGVLFRFGSFPKKAIVDGIFLSTQFRHNKYGRLAFRFCKFRDTTFEDMREDMDDVLFRHCDFFNVSFQGRWKELNFHKCRGTILINGKAICLHGEGNPNNSLLKELAAKNAGREVSHFKAFNWQLIKPSHGHSH